jgi:hypothetical protein
MTVDWKCIANIEFGIAPLKAFFLFCMQEGKEVFIPYGQIILRVWLCIACAAGGTESTYVSLQTPSTLLQIIIILQF